MNEGSPAAWVHKAEEDWFVVQRCLEDVDRLPDIIAFHCQQCAEKYLKALLRHQEVAFARTHDLGMLLDQLIVIYSQLKVLDRECDVLSQYAAAGRYPGEESSVADANEATTMAARGREVGRRLLSI